MKDNAAKNRLKAALAEARKAQWSDSVEVKVDEAIIKTADLAALIAIVEAAENISGNEIWGLEELEAALAALDSNS